MLTINTLVKALHKNNFSYKRRTQFMTSAPNFRGQVTPWPGLPEPVVLWAPLPGLLASWLVVC